MNIPLMRSQEQAPTPPKPVDAFLQEASKLQGLYTVSAYGFGGMMLGLCIHSFPQFRAIAVAVVVITSVGLAAMAGYPVVMGNIQHMRRNGLGRVYAGGKVPKVLDEAAMMAMFAPVGALLLTVLAGFVIGAL